MLRTSWPVPRFALLICIGAREPGGRCRVILRVANNPQVEAGAASASNSMCARVQTTIQSQIGPKRMGRAVFAAPKRTHRYIRRAWRRVLIHKHGVAHLCRCCSVLPRDRRSGSLSCLACLPYLRSTGGGRCRVRIASCI